MSTLKIVTSTSIGLAAGLAVGFLTAPRSGKKTRKMISNEVDAQMKSLGHELDKKVDEVKKNYNNQVERITDNGKSTLERAKELVSVN
ncbi:MAG: YtxH domain-containing protein [Bacteroidota bacterium]